MACAPCTTASARVRIAKRSVIWLPIAIVMIAFLFFPETWAVVSHLSHPGSGRLLGYRVSIPVNWVVLTDEPDIGSSHTWSSVAAFHSKGVLRAGASAYWRREPPIANMSFYAAPLGDRGPRLLPNDKIISIRTLPLGIICSEYIPGWLREREHDDIRFIACTTPQNDFYGWFDGDKASLTDFYRTLEQVRQTN